MTSDHEPNTAIRTEPTEGETTSTASSAAAVRPSAPRSPEDLHDDVVMMLKTCYDPEIPVDIYELGLIYSIEVREGNAIYIEMTLTSPMCPVAETLPPEVEAKVRTVPGVSGVQLDLVWDPPWSPDLMSEAARLTLNL
jgi:FeS assembly SUF system protein